MYISMIWGPKSGEGTDPTSRQQLNEENGLDLNSESLAEKEEGNACLGLDDETPENHINSQKF